MKRVFRWIGAAALFLAVVAAAYPAVRLFDLYLGSHVVETPRGPVEIAREGAGPPVLVLHGIAGGYDQGLLFGGPLAQNGFEIISISRPGYMRTPLSSGATPGQQAEMLAALLDTLGIPKAVVMGISAGGPAAIEFALRHPERVSGLVLFSAGGESRVTEHLDLAREVRGEIKSRALRWDFYALSASIAVRVDPRPVLDQILAMMDRRKAGNRPAIVAAVLSSPERRTYLDHLVDSTFPISGKVDGIGNDLDGVLHPQDLPLERIAVPTLIIHGDADRLLPFAGAVAAQKRIPGSVLVGVHDAGHLVQLGPHDREVDAALVDFCRKVSGK